MQHWLRIIIMLKYLFSLILWIYISRVYFRGGRGAFAPPMKVFAPPQELVELYILNFGHAYRDKSNSGLYNHWVV